MQLNRKLGDSPRFFGDSPQISGACPRLFGVCPPSLKDLKNRSQIAEGGGTATEINGRELGDRPLFFGDRPLVFGDRPLFFGDRPLVFGDRPSFFGVCPQCGDLRGEAGAVCAARLGRGTRAGMKRAVRALSPAEREVCVQIHRPMRRTGRRLGRRLRNERAAGSRRRSTSPRSCRRSRRSRRQR